MQAARPPDRGVEPEPCKPRQRQRHREQRRSRATAVPEKGVTAAGLGPVRAVPATALFGCMRLIVQLEEIGDRRPKHPGDMKEAPSRDTALPAFIFVRLLERDTDIMR